MNGDTFSTGDEQVLTPPGTMFLNCCARGSLYFAGNRVPQLLVKKTVQTITSKRAVDE
jgi:hypothetical protein